MIKEELKAYKHDKKYIEEKIIELEEFGTNLNHLTSVISDMPKRKNRDRRYDGRKYSKVVGL